MHPRNSHRDPFACRASEDYSIMTSRGHFSEETETSCKGKLSLGENFCCPVESLLWPVSYYDYSTAWTPDRMSTFSSLERMAVVRQPTPRCHSDLSFSQVPLSSSQLLFGALRNLLSRVLTKKPTSKLECSENIKVRAGQFSQANAPHKHSTVRISVIQSSNQCGGFKKRVWDLHSASPTAIFWGIS